MKSKADYHLLSKLRKAYTNGENISSYLKAQHDELDEVKVIEYAYDLQSGSYVDHFVGNKLFYEDYTDEMIAYAGSHIKSGRRLLDAGCGELTTSTSVWKKLPANMQYFATDISWSRLYTGCNYFADEMRDFTDVNLFVSDFSQLPLPSNGVDYIITNHALEPNGKNLHVVLQEFMRVAADKLFLFEPWYEGNSVEGRARMDSLGYIKGLESAIQDLGGDLVDVIRMKHKANPLNPTACFIVDVSKTDPIMKRKSDFFTFPGTESTLGKVDGYFTSDVGYLFPVLKGIPLLKRDNGIIASSF